ncbi:oxaloacetate decarboxylase [Flammeovirga sp. SJP92]|uniref:isocitrate lyase/PEP mutase family protein n=1 Tax=Flammeovirga sp. SJP92 TaxID=1775430 RepID=UPI000787B09B|nr:isocitrate lyase/PEP mutase family protein [Flammeovirga sp. SJP92]KXX66865.1 hypothetical protein AVL50_30505 [Flammeovirga sp. SJP92]
MTQDLILKQLIEDKETLVMPNAYDPISARIIEDLGFKAVQCSGYSFAIASCKKEEIDIDFKENLSITHKIVDAVSIPVMADGEDGFGGIDFIPTLIEEFLDIGVAGINIEDQILEKNTNRKIVESSVLVEKIQVAKQSALDHHHSHFIINGRTDALNTFGTRKEGLKESIKRANLYLEAGADLVFITAVSTLEEAKLLVREINGPLSIAAGLPYNINNFSLNDLKEIGVARISLPTIAIQTIIKSLSHSFQALNTGDFKSLMDQEMLCESNDIQRLIGRF